nr:hypothetical protein L204_05267 [Cryptococcus depauperatus CBS 7855]
MYKKPSTAPSHSRNPSSASIITPAAVKPKSATARRMSHTSTLQSASIFPKTFLGSILDNQQTVLAGIVCSLMLQVVFKGYSNANQLYSCGIMYSLVFNTSLNTSEIHHSHLPERTAYFAKKSNILNVVFVKCAWAWTSGAYLLHLLTARSRSGLSVQKLRGIAAWLLATLCWAIFTRWFFGAGLGDRIIALTGGNCALLLPPSISPVLAKHHFAKLFTSGASDSEGRLYVQIPHDFCSGAPLTPSTLPELFALLPKFDNLRDGPTASHESLRPLSRPRWHRGFDISGHSFLLTLSIMLLGRELISSWRVWVLSGRIHQSRKLDYCTRLHTLAGIVGTILIGVWMWMIVMTGVYFHNPPEKLAGIVLGLLSSTLIHIITPSLPSLSPFRAQITTTKPAFSMAFDENRARRGNFDGDGFMHEPAEKQVDKM